MVITKSEENHHIRCQHTGRDTAAVGCCPCARVCPKCHAAVGTKCFEKNRWGYGETAVDSFHKERL